MSSNDEIFANITAQGQLQKDFARQIVEATSSMMAKNLMTFLDRQAEISEQQASRIQNEVKETVSASAAALRADFQEVGENLDQRLSTIDHHITTIYERQRTFDARLRTVEDTVRAHNDSRDASIRERAELRQALEDLREQLSEFSAFRDQINGLVAQGFTGDRFRRYLRLLEHYEKEMATRGDAEKEKGKDI